MRSARYHRQVYDWDALTRFQVDTPEDDEPHVDAAMLTDASAKPTSSTAAKASAAAKIHATP